MKKLHKNLCVIEANDLATLEEISLAMEKAGILIQRLSKQFVAVEPSRIDEVLRLLKDLGHLPKVMN